MQDTDDEIIGGTAEVGGLSDDGVWTEPPPYKHDVVVSTGKGEDLLDIGSAEADAETILEARIPLLTGSANKMRYLSYRAMGFTVKEAAGLTDVTLSTVNSWRFNDPEFKEWEGRLIGELQKSMAGDLLRMEFMRNMRLAFNRDHQVLYKAACSLGGLTDREFAYLKMIRPLYQPSDLVALDKAVAPDLEGGRVTATMTIEVSGAAVSDEHARRAGARQLLERFTTNTDLIVQDEDDGSSN